MVYILNVRQPKLTNMSYDEQQQERMKKMNEKEMFISMDYLYHSGIDTDWHITMEVIAVVYWPVEVGSDI